MTDKNYKLIISMNVLNHLGMSLYSNTPAVLSEVIANAWDADATEVNIDYSEENNESVITISDNGYGMDYNDIQDKYLHVGYSKREEHPVTHEGRKPMGRKGIGKLSVFSIAKKISVCTKKEGKEGEAFELDSDDIEQYIKNHENTQNKENQYQISALPFDSDIERGTIIKITRFKRNLTQNTFKGLKKRIARRFSVIGDKHNFNVILDGEKITVADREYFHKARFLFQYGDDDFSQYCKKLDKSDDGEKLCFRRNCQFDKIGKENEQEQYSVKGWIAIAHHSNDLDGGPQEDDNLNNITLVVRGKVAQEDILYEHRLGGMITKYIYGEIHADFLDTEEIDIATSSRQKIIEDDPRYKSLKAFIGSELKYIWKETNKLKDKKSLQTAILFSPHIEEWFNQLQSDSLKAKAMEMLAVIDKSGADDKNKKELYANTVIAFEKMKMRNTMEKLDSITEDNATALLTFFNDIDDIEAAYYHEIVEERLKIINQLNNKTIENVLESNLRDYIYDHLWLLDPAWERTTENASMEKRINLKLSDNNSQQLRTDIRYRIAQREHVIIELKRFERRLPKTEIEEQVKKYKKAVEQEIKMTNTKDLPVTAICIVGKLPTGWDNQVTRKLDEDSLAHYNIRIMTYQEMIDNADSVYSEFLKAYKKISNLAELIEKIRKN